MEIIKSILGWMWSNKHLTGYGLLIVIIMLLSWSNSRKNIAIESLNLNNKTLLANQSAKIIGSQIVYRDKDHVVVKYLPAEGDVTIKKDEKTNIETVVVKNKGFCFRPGIALVYSDKLDGALDCKFLYWDRYSAGLGVNLDYGYLWGSRHLDDVSLNLLKNTEAIAGIGKTFNGGVTRFVLGIRINL